MERHSFRIVSGDSPEHDSPSLASYWLDIFKPIYSLVSRYRLSIVIYATQLTFNCSKSTIEVLEKGKREYVQS